ncbi:MAG: hypothetical protein HKP12_04995 [Gammaproteobacteria bacterium]|nr:hypothetical protein [Gammaproteobacteria bacterium]
MKLNIIVDGRSNGFEVPDYLLEDAVDFFEKLDKDMDRGWQMSRDWVDSPNPEQRCQIAADKILTAIENDNEKLLMLMAAYILRTMPGVTGINIDITGDMNETEIIMGHQDSRPLGPILG